MRIELVPHVQDPVVAGMALAAICDVLGKAETDQWVEEPSEAGQLAHYLLWVTTVRACGFDEMDLKPRYAEAAVDFRSWLLSPLHTRDAFWPTLESSADTAVATLRANWTGGDSDRYDFCRAFAYLLTYDGVMNDNKRVLLDIVLGGLNITPTMWASVANNPNA